MTRFLYRSGCWAALHPWRAIAGWLTFTALLLGLAAGFGGTPQDNWNVPGTEAQEGLELLRDHVPGAGKASARVVVTVSEPQLSADRDTAMLLVGYDEEVTHPGPANCPRPPRPR